MADPLVRGIITGGQSGVDRGALDAAIGSGIPVDGWCPAGRLAEDGRIDTLYPLRETPEPRMSQRTSWNVYDSDATLVICDTQPDGGTGYTLNVARTTDRPHLVTTSGPEAAPVIRDWLEQFEEPPLLNVAGPRESKAPGIANRTRILLDNVFVNAPVRSLLPRPSALITGSAGYLGSRLTQLCPPGRRVIRHVRKGGGAAEPDLRCAELSDDSAVQAMLDHVGPDLVIHTAYSTSDLQRDVVHASRNVARAAADRGIALIHCSSDMVFDGRNAPYDEKAAPSPLHPYGRAKAEGERAVLEECPDAVVLRFSLVTSLEPPDPRSAWILEGLRGGEPPSLFVDEIRSPIHPLDLARCIWEIARIPRDQRKGVWHLAGAEALSRYAIGLLVAARHRLDPAPIRMARSEEVDTSRPRDLRLVTRRADRHLLTRPRPLSEQILFDFQHSR